MKKSTLQNMVRERFDVSTSGRGLTEITDRVRQVLTESGLHDGMTHVFVHHTSCSLMIGENADPTVCADMDRFFARLVSDGDPLFQHDAEGPDDMPAHVRSMLTGTSLAIPFSDGHLDLGTWQGAFLWEHRTRPHTRHVTVTLIGSTGS